MKIHAQTRLTALSSGGQLYEFIISLQPKERVFFYEGLPKLLDKWFDGMQKDSAHLPIQFASHQLEAAKYKDVDAIAIALGYLRPIYTPKLPKMVYRSILSDKINKLPKTKTINFKSDKKWSALQSWTVNKQPVVADRDVNEEKQIEMVLELPAAKANKHVVTDYVQLQKLCKDAIALCPRINKYLEKQGIEGDFDDHYWKRALHGILNFKHEKEVLMYVPAGTALRCTWRAYTLNRRGEPIAQIK